MKKIVWGFFGLLLIGIILFNNPIATPQAYISELYFDQTGKWLLEISFEYSQPFNHSDYDSLYIASLSGTSKIRLNYVRDSSDYIIISEDSLLSPLQIDISGDSLTLYTYINDEPHWVTSHTLLFGNVSGSLIDTIKQGSSIAKMNYGVFSKDISPTLGLPNDTSGTCATLTGYLYDKIGTPVTNIECYYDFYSTTSTNGKFVMPIHSRKAVIGSVYILTDYHKYEPIDTFIINPNPGEIIVHDIHLKGDYIVGIENSPEVYTKNLEIVNYPNPFNSSTNFYITIPNHISYSEGVVKIYNVNGEEVYSIPVDANSTLQWHGTDKYGKTLSSGVYYYQLSLDNKIKASGSMILLK